MAIAISTAQISPGKGLGFFALGASLHNVLSRLKAQPQIYPSLDLTYSSSEPVLEPIVLSLPANGIRLRFDGPDQRLRLIEVLDFTKIQLTYKDHEVVKGVKASGDQLTEENTSPQGPSFRHVYNRLFGPSYPGEYIPPTNVDAPNGTYVLSYPGIAFSFPLQDSVWSQQSDFVNLLSSSAASPATSMAIFHGSSWPVARTDLFTRQPQYPRSTAMNSRSKEVAPDEIELAQIHGAGKIQLVRRASPPLLITLSETTSQDLVAELGPPDAIYRKNDRRISIHGAHPVLGKAGARQASASPSRHDDSTDTDQSSAQSFTDDSDAENASSKPHNASSIATECFYNYFHHGFDAFISYPATISPELPGSSPAEEAGLPSSGPHMTVTKFLLHGNVPGSYPFNRHRRIRWTIDFDPELFLASEMRFSQISQSLKAFWKDSYASKEEEQSLNRGMVLNRGWGDSPGSSLELLGGWEENVEGRKSSAAIAAESEQGLGNTELFGFPGLLFEVLKNGTVSCLTIY